MTQESYGEEPQRNTFDWRTWIHPQHIPARGVLGIISFFGFFTNYMLRVNINIAIVSMTQSAGGGTAQNELNASDCISDDDALNVTFSKPSNHQPQVAEFTWNAQDQALVLGSFYWAYIISLVPGGMLAERYGSKWVFGGANFVHGVMALITPFAARWNLIALIAVRLIQGLASGMTWPAMHAMASRWIPADERSKFVATYMGNAVGTAVTFPLCGYLIEWLDSWVWAFYVPALITLTWCAFWFYLAYDSPAQHPRITLAEKAYLERTVTPHLSKVKLRLPWMKVVKSLPFWALLIANSGSVWGFMTIVTYGPTYLKTVHGVGVKANGLLSGLPNLSRFLMAVIFSWFVDSLLAARKCTVTFVRKMATAIALVLPALLFLLMGRMGCNAAAEVAVLTIASAFGGCASSGPIVNSVDLAPNFSGTILGIVSVAAMSSGFTVPLLVSAIIRNDQSISSWRLVFLAAAFFNFVSVVVYSLFGSGEVQPWNEPDTQDAEDTPEEEETQKINDSNNKNHVL